MMTRRRRFSAVPAFNPKQALNFQVSGTRTGRFSSSGVVLPDVEGKARWRLVDKRRVKREIREACARVRAHRVAFKTKQRELSKLEDSSDDQEMSTLRDELCALTQVATQLTTFARWLNGESTFMLRMARLDLHLLLTRYKIEAITALAELGRE